MKHAIISITAIFCVCLACFVGHQFSKAADAPSTSGAHVILNTGSYCRYFLTARKPVMRKDNQLVDITSVNPDSALPPADWTAADFDDSAWVWQRGPLFKSTDPKLEGSGYGGVIDESHPDMALLCVREKFAVEDSTKARDLTFSVAYRGGVVVYINGKELARGNMPDTKGGMESLAEEYPAEAFVEKGKLIVGSDIQRDPALLKRRIRHLDQLTVPASSLRQGVNVLALELHRAAYPPEMRRPIADRQDTSVWCTVGLVSLDLKGGGPGIVANIAPPPGVHIWTKDASDRTFVDEWADINEKPGIVKLDGVRNGAFSGQVLVGSPTEIKGLKVEVSDLTGAGAIPASAVQVRYSRPDGQPGGMQHFDSGKGYPGCFNTLDTHMADTISPVGGASSALQPVFLTVHVPKDAKPGQYKGKIIVKADGAAEMEMPLELSVADWTLPDPRDFQTYMGLVESPESVALQYGVEPWSEKHWQLLEKVFDLMGEVGERDVYILMERKLQVGNAQSMVRWIRKDGGGFTYDFSIVERYLDLAVKHLHNPPTVSLYCWDQSNGFQYGKQENKAASAGFLYTILDPKTGTLEEAEGPKYGTPEIREFLKPVFDELRKIVAARGMEKTTMLAMWGDVHPTNAVFDDLAAVAPGFKWMSATHPEPKAAFYGHPMKDVLGYYTFVYAGDELPDPVDGIRRYGWQDETIFKTDFPRPAGLPHNNDISDRTVPSRLRCYLESCLVYGLRGIGRVGVDFWPVVKNGAGKKEFGGNTVMSRFPINDWHQLSVGASAKVLLTPGKDGPLAMLSLEMFRACAQECEARIYLEKALLDKDKRAKLGEELAKRCQAMLDARQRDLIRFNHSWWFYQGWEERAGDLWRLTAEAAAKLGG